MNRTTLTALAVFAILLLAVVLRVGQETERGISRISLAHVKPDAIDRIVVRGDNPAEFRKDGEIWRLANGREAEANAVMRLMESIPKIASSDLVTRDPNRFAEFGLDEEGGAGLQAYSGDRVLAEFVVGQQARGGTYVLVEDGVYKVAGIYRGAFSRPDWLERRLFKDELAAVTQVELRLAGQPAYTITSQGNEWPLLDPNSVPKGFRFDARAAYRLANTFLALRAKDILDEDPGAEKTGLGEGADVLAYVLEADEGEGTRYELRLGAETDGGDVYAEIVGRDDILTLNPQAARNLRKAATDLRDLSLVRLDPAKVKKLHIVDGKRRLELQKQETGWEIASSTEPEPDDFVLDPIAIQRRLAAFANARGVSLADSKKLKKTRLNKPQAEVSATLDDDSVVALAFGRETKDEDKRAVLYAKGNADDEVYWVTASTRTSLTGGLDTFKKRAPVSRPGGIPNLDPETLSNLPPEVREALLKQLREQHQQQELLKKLQAQQ